MTICAQHRKCLFGTIIDGRMQLNEIGEIIVECWNHILQHFPSVGLGDYIIMLNYIHGIITQNIVEARSLRPTENASDRRGEVSSPAHRGSPALGKVVVISNINPPSKSTNVVTRPERAFGKEIITIISSEMTQIYNKFANTFRITR